MFIKINHSKTCLSRFVVALFSFLIIFSTIAVSFGQTEPIIIDHNCINLEKIPVQWIDSVKANLKMYYGHTSHGTQLTEGLQIIESNFASLYNVAIDWNLPTESDAFCIRDRGDTYNPEDFFPTVPAALSTNPEINVVMFGWCGQPGSNWEPLFNSYINDAETLESQYPQITFIYMTGHAQENDCSGCSRYRFNQALRQYCREQNKVLFDFVDFDVWYNGEQHTYICPNWCDCAGESIPLEHPHYKGNQAGHTSVMSS